MANELDRKEHAILRKEGQKRDAVFMQPCRVKDFSEEQIAKEAHIQRVQKVRMYLKFRAKHGCPLLPKSK